MCKGGCPAIVNSPYPFIQGPPDEVEHFAKKIGALEESPGVVSYDFDFFFHCTLKSLFISLIL